MDLRMVHVSPLDKKPHNKEYKYITLLFKTLQIVFGFDLGFFAHKSLRFRVIIKIFSLVHFVVAGVFIFKDLIENEYNFTKSWSVIFFLNHLCVVLVLTFSKRGATFMDLHECLEEIDVKLRVDFSCNNAEFKLILSILFIYIERLCVDIFYLLINPYDFLSLWEDYAFVFLSACSDIFLSCYSFMFYSLYLRLAKLSPMLETNNDLYSVWRLYKTIVDTVEKFKATFDPVFMLILLWNVPQVMSSIYYSLTKLQDPTDVIFMTIVVEYSYVLTVFVFTVAPALIADMLTKQAEKIKTILHEKSFHREMQDKEFLLRFIKYVEARPCRFHVWKVIPLSADLLGMVLSFCVTYLIIIVQFTSLK